MHSSLAFLLLFLVSIQLSNAAQAGTPVILPAIQTSVTSTQFNPGLTNAGGTTNSAGTFNVVSLAQSTSFNYDTNIPQTTSFVVNPAPFAASANVSTPAYFTATPKATTPGAPAKSSQMSISLVTTRSVPVSALVTNNSDGAQMNIAWGGVWTLAVSATLAVVGAVIVL